MSWSFWLGWEQEAGSSGRGMCWSDYSATWKLLDLLSDRQLVAGGPRRGRDDRGPGQAKRATKSAPHSWGSAMWGLSSHTHVREHTRTVTSYSIQYWFTNAVDLNIIWSILIGFIPHSKFCFLLAKKKNNKAIRWSFMTTLIMTSFFYSRFL